MGEIFYPDPGSLQVQESGGAEVHTMSIVYSRRERFLHVKSLTDDVTEELRGNTHSEKVFCSLKSVSTLGDETQVSDSAEALAFCIKDASALSLARIESPDSPGTPAASFTEDRAAWSVPATASSQASSEIDDLFLAGSNVSPNELECYSCKSFIPSSPMISCCQKGCKWTYHKSCAKKLRDCSWRRNGKLICPQHVCHACGGSRSGRLWRCQRCPIASHEPCCPWPEEVNFSEDSPGWAICWRHDIGERTDNFSPSALSHLHKQRASDTKEVFNRLPVLDVVEDFTVSLKILKEVADNDKEPPPYTHIRRNVFLIKKKRDDSDDGMSCSCGIQGSECGEDCDCRVQSMSCSKDCVCKNVCTNKPYRKEKRLKVVKTEFCGWGAKAAEIIRKRDFIIEYIGEVIDDALCENRLWAMKGRGNNKFYMCEIAKDFIIDATFKGNPSRFLNHSCQPNCKLEKWRVDGETRVGVFALRDILVGEPLTYDYRYVEFGANVKCHCGAPKCRGAIGESFQRSMMEEILKWGKKGRRSCGRCSKRSSFLDNQPWLELGTSHC